MRLTYELNSEDPLLKKVLAALVFGCIGSWVFYGQAIALYFLFTGSGFCR